MGVSISMRPGTVGRSLGVLVNITPGWRSQAASVLRNRFSGFPMELTAVQDLSMVQAMGDGASVYTRDEENIWKIIAEAMVEHGVVTLIAE
jgi:hypothetical protein